ncbi:winged helix-turn-helix transcriptional regulator, partial [Escherichia coli]|uniref:winged helix-turn-helix transcriptional regulator n=2 Tax=Pseudomonadota TaxID=1224 RepID=UPI0012903A23
MPSTRWSHCGTEDLNVLQTIFWSAGASRNALAQRLAYSKSKANAMVAALLDEGLLDEVGLQESSGGRRAETLRLSETLGVVIGADLGATSMQIAVMRPDMTV